MEQRHIADAEGDRVTGGPSAPDRHAGALCVPGAAGQTVRSMVDCLIAATALRFGRPVLHLDRDFELLAAVSPLELVEV